MAIARDNPEIYFLLLPICREAIVNKVTCRHLIEGQRTSPPKPQNRIQGVTQRMKFPESDSKVPRCATALQMSPASAQHQSLCVRGSADLPRPSLRGRCWRHKSFWSWGPYVSNQGGMQGML